MIVNTRTIDVGYHGIAYQLPGTQVAQHFLRAASGSKNALSLEGVPSQQICILPRIPVHPLRRLDVKFGESLFLFPLSRKSLFRPGLCKGRVERRGGIEDWLNRHFETESKPAHLKPKIKS